MIACFHSDTLSYHWILEKSKEKGRSTQTDAMRILFRQETDNTLAFQRIEYRKRHFVHRDKYRFCTHPLRNMRESQYLSIGMRMLVIRRRMRMHNHHSVDIVYVWKHRNADLIGYKQSQQKQGSEYVRSFLHQFLKIGGKSSFFCLKLQI